MEGSFGLSVTFSLISKGLVVLRVQIRRGHGINLEVGMVLGLVELGP
jgi:hypothetical protein